MYQLIKRFFDFFVALIAIIILSPLLIPITIGLLLTGEHHVFYFQERIGHKNKKFDIWKFATMLKDSPNMTGGLITLKNDPRLTPMGGFLRKTKINELPQLFNVLIGDMSFVGPRPVMQKSFEQYPKEVQKVIYSVKPGLTGVGSIIFRDEEELITIQKELGNDPWEFYKNVIYPYKGKVEEWYQKHTSFKTDTLVLFLTVWAILFPKSELHFKVFKDIPKRPSQLS
jgi:lipopolysaccharide/colanic/teichoic acid biosynthesis glycosyltransferase